jgi:hypothetical protein
MKTLIALLAFATPAHAVDMLPFYDNAPKVQKASHVATPRHKAKPRKARKQGHSFRPAPAAPVTPLATEAVTRCLAPVRVVGSQDVRADAAEQSAQKAWMEMVRWQSGEAFQDFANAKDYQKRCSRSSIGEALGQFFTRCEITASPCRPGMVEGTQ